jgi:hypothetical protein
MVTSLSLTGHEVHTLGRVSRFLENTFPGKKYLAEPVYRVLYTEVDRRTGASSPDSIAGLLERKGLGRRDLVQLLHTLGASIDFQSGWETCKSILLRDGWAGREIVALESAWRRCEVDRMSQVTSLPYLRLRESATAFAAKSSREDNLSTYVANGDAELRKVCPGELTAYGTVYGKAMLLMELYANWESSPASAELEKEEP